MDGFVKLAKIEKRVRVGYSLPLSLVEEIQRRAIAKGRNIRPCHIVEDILRREIGVRKENYSNLDGQN